MWYDIFMEKYIIYAKDFLAKLVQFKSFKQEGKDGTPFGEEINKALLFSLAELDNLGGSSTNLDGYCGFSDFGEGELFGILLHLDVVPVEKDWKFDPFVLTESDGRLYARGTVDDKGPFAAILTAFKMLLDEGLQPKKRVRFILGCDEESGWSCMSHYCKKAELPKKGFAPDACFPVINYEKGILRFSFSIDKPDIITSIDGGTRSNVVAPFARFKSPYYLNLDKVKHKNVLNEKVNYSYSFSGKAAHASTPECGKNAIVEMLRFLADVFSSDVYKSKKDLENINNVLFLISDKGFASITNDAYQSSELRNIKLTSNLGICSLSDNKLSFCIDIRYPKEISPEEIVSFAKNYVEVDDNSINISKPLYVDKDNELVKTLLESYEYVTGEKAEPIAIGGGTYARALPLAVAFGPMFPGEEEQAHMTNESISIDNFIKTIKIYYEALKRLLF